MIELISEIVIVDNGAFSNPWILTIGLHKYIEEKVKESVIVCKPVFYLLLFILCSSSLDGMKL